MMHVPFWYRLWRWFVCLFTGSPETPRESHLAAMVDDLRTQNGLLAQQVREQQAQLEIHQLELKMLTAVIERDRTRIQAEQVAYAVHVAAAERAKPQQQAGGYPP